MKPRLTIITEIIAPYRIPVFNALGREVAIDLHVIFLAETDPPMREWRVYRDEIRFSYDILPSWRRRFGKYNLLLNQHVARALEDAAPDVVLCGGYNYVASWQALHWARRTDVPFLLWSESTINDQRSAHPVIEGLKRNFIRNCAGFVVPGISAKGYVQRLQERAENIFVAPNAIDNELFASRAALARINASRLRGELALPSRYFLFVGRIVKEKGVFDLLEGYSRLPERLRSEIGLVFVGNGPARAELESVSRSVFPGTVHFAGFVHRDELADYYALAECFVFPSHTDPWGLVVNEAMACGLPVICSRTAGCGADLIRTNGILVESADPADLAVAMEKTSTSESGRAQMALESQAIIRSYSPELCAAGIARAATAVAGKRDDFDMHSVDLQGAERTWLNT